MEPDEMIGIYRRVGGHGQGLVTGVGISSFSFSIESVFGQFLVQKRTTITPRGNGVNFKNNRHFRLYSTRGYRVPVEYGIGTVPGTVQIVYSTVHRTVQ